MTDDPKLADDQPLSRRRKRRWKFHQLTVGEDLYQRWHDVAKDQGMETDSEIANYLLRRYENERTASKSTPTQCTTCRTPLVLYCATCRSFPPLVSPQTSSITHSSLSQPESESALPLSSSPKVGPSSQECSTLSESPFLLHSAEASPEKCAKLLLTSPPSPDGCLPSETLQNNGARETEKVKTASRRRKCVLRKQRRHAGKATLSAVRNMLKKSRSSDVVADTGDPDSEIPLCYKDSVETDMTAEQVDPSPQADDGSSQADDGTNGLCNSSVEEPQTYVDQTNASSSETKDENLTHSCSVCKAQFPFKSRLARHMTTHVKVKGHHCKECGAGFTRALTLRDHIAAAHGTDKNFKCTQCDATFSKSNGLTLHVRKCHADSMLSCDKCQTKFLRVCDLRVHVHSKHAQSVDKSYVCQVCGQAYTAASNLTIHMRKHSGLRPYLCQECGATFTSSSHLQGHMMRHTGVKPYSCEQCNAAFSKQHDLKVHQRSHSGEKPFQCEQCGKAFSTSSSLARHSQGHQGSKRYQCPECPAAFSYTSTLKIHRRQHTGELLKCETCDKSFLERRSLVVHLRTHTGEKPFSCPHCSAAFRNPNSLKQHLPVHTGNKPHKCRHCGKSFALSSKLARHIKKHNGDKPYVTKPYSCHLCSSAFTQSATLAAHLNKKHSFTVDQSAIPDPRMSVPTVAVPFVEPNLMYPSAGMDCMPMYFQEQPSSVNPQMLDYLPS